MTDLDADEKIPPLKTPRRFRLRSADNALIAGGIALALLATFFPWYVFFNEEQFRYRPDGVISSRDLPELPTRLVVNPSPSAVPDSDAADTSVNSPDPVVTATVPEETTATEPADLGDEAADQPLPRDTRFRLLHVANGQALIESAAGIYLARVGERLPDDSLIATLEERDGRWVLVTDGGKVVPVADPDAPLK